MRDVNSSDRIRGVVFDMDGTLFSTQALIVYCVNETARKYLKRPLPPEDNLWKFGPPARNIVRSFASLLPDGSVEQAVEDYGTVYRSNLRDKAVQFPAIPKLLKELRTSMKSLAIVTSETMEFSDYALEAFRLKDYFDSLVTSDHVSKRKPDPEGIHLTLQRLKLPPRECMMIGDSAVDIIAGKNAGLLTGAALWGSETWGDPRPAKPDYLFQDPMELAGFFSHSG